MRTSFVLIAKGVRIHNLAKTLTIIFNNNETQSKYTKVTRTFCIYFLHLRRVRLEANHDWSPWLSSRC